LLTLSVVQAATRRAAASGALQPIETQSLALEHAGVQFALRAVSSLARKQAARAAADALGDYEPDLFVCPVAPGYYVLLNKFNVLPYHLLIVTRRFEPQEALLTVPDFEALARCMAGFGDLAFYNCGAQAGASQPRKHLQLLPMAEIPIEPFLDAGGELPFRHACARIPAAADAALLHRHYRDLLQACAMAGPSYNLVVTRRWMLLVPRARERFESISVNGLGFAGSLFVRTQEQLERVRAFGPMNVLRQVTLA
jgi:sulfate adenylyltransferase (ADP) / ATP adenylyltransferase